MHMRPLAIPRYIKQHDQPKEVLKTKIEGIRRSIEQLYADDPDVSIIIPAYNEESNILKTLSSLSASTTTKKVEIIVVNNNSADDTGTLANASGAWCIVEKKQGITHARNAGLNIARGNYILNADADTIYPPGWIDLMTAPLQQANTAMAYGRFSFLPVNYTRRVAYLGYEYISDFSKWINKTFREEAVNIYGSNSAFRRVEGLRVGGFDHPPGTNEDGWLGMKLRDALSKRLYQVRDARAIVWTMDRRILMDGGLLKGSIKRVKRHVNLLLHDK